MSEPDPPRPARHVDVNVRIREEADQRVQAMKQEALAHPPPWGLWVVDLAGYCPTQGHGAFEGHPFYFRARHGGWELLVVEPGEDPSDWEGRFLMHLEGDDPAGPYSMECDAAMRIIADAYLRFGREHGERILAYHRQQAGGAT